MSTGTTEVTKSVEQMTADERLAHFGKPPDGFRYLKANGNYIIDGATGKPVLVKKKASTKRKKATKPQYTVPATKLRSSETPGFDIGSHARLKFSDFADPLHFAEWDLWYYRQKVAQCEMNVKNIASSGATPEERQAKQNDVKVLNATAALVAKAKSLPAGSAKTALQAQLAELFASVMES